MSAANTASMDTPLVIQQVKSQPEIVTESVGDNDQNELPDKLPASVEEAQQGTRNIEAVTLTWTKTSLAMVFIKYDLHSRLQVAAY